MKNRCCNETGFKMFEKSHICGNYDVTTTCVQVKKDCGSTGLLNASARTTGADFQVNVQRASTQETILFNIYSSSSAYIVLCRQIKDEALFTLFS